MTRSILHVAQPTVAGVPAVTIGLAADHVRRGWRVAIVCPPGGDLARWSRERGIEHIPWHATRQPGPAVIGETRSLGAIVTRVSPDIVHLHSAKAGLAGRLPKKRRSRAVVYQPHGWSFDAVTGLVAAGARAWERIGSRRCDAIVCVSEAERSNGIAIGISRTMEVIPNGVDLERFRPLSAADRAQLRERLGMPEAPIALCVGRLSSEKGQDVLLDAWRLVRADVPDAVLFLVGDGPDEGSLRQRAPEGVVFVGRRSDVADWMAAVDVVVVPSRREGMSLSMLEAMAAGRPIVCTDVPGAMEGVGAVVPIEDPPALAAGLVRWLRDPAAAGEEGARLRHRAEERYSSERAWAEMAALYDRLLAQE